MHIVGIQVLECVAYYRIRGPPEASRYQVELVIPVKQSRRNGGASDQRWNSGGPIGRPWQKACLEIWWAVNVKVDAWKSDALGSTRLIGLFDGTVGQSKQQTEA